MLLVDCRRLVPRRFSDVSTAWTLSFIESCVFFFVGLELVSDVFWTRELTVRAFFLAGLAGALCFLDGMHDLPYQLAMDGA